MRKVLGPTLSILLLLSLLEGTGGFVGPCAFGASRSGAAATGSGSAAQDVFEYPSVLLDAYDADTGCWKGMDAWGAYPVPVLPDQWLVGAPPSDNSAVTIPVDHWVELGFSGKIADGEGEDIVVVETGRAGEQALLFVTDGADREYLLTKVVIEIGAQDLTYVKVDLRGVLLPFVPRAIRLIALDRGGLSPGFDLAYAQARVSHACGTQACCPNPLDGSANVSPSTELTWAPGSLADQHVVYLGPVASEVRTRSPAVRYPAQPRDVNTLEPAGLLLGETYYWRVDEIGAPDANQVRGGDLWSFTVADHLVVDDFEGYAGARMIYDVWQPVGWSGASLEEVVTDVCQHSLIYSYYYDKYMFSSVGRRFDEPQDWTRAGARVLQLLLHGDLPDPATGEMYIALTDGVGEQLLPCSGLAEVEGRPGWHTWRVLLDDVHDIDLTQIRGMAIGVRSRPSLPASAVCRGNMGIAEIGLYRAVCLADLRPRADVTADCAVDYRDLEQMALDWLVDRTRACQVVAPNEPVLWYEFEGDAHDSAGDAHGQVEGRVNFGPGVYGQAIHFMNQGDRVTIPNAVRVFARARDALTITFWQYGDDSSHRTDTLCCSNYTYGQSDPTIAIHLGCWQPPGSYRWDCGDPWSFSSRLAGRHRSESEWRGRWNHWAFTKDTRVGPAGQKGRMETYLNGDLYDRRTGTSTAITGITSFEIGSGWYGYYDGLIDDFQIYDYALSPAEVAYVATDGTGMFRQKPTSPADVDDSDKVDLHDFSILAEEWLKDGLWP